MLLKLIYFYDIFNLLATRTVLQLSIVVLVSERIHRYKIELKWHLQYQWSLDLLRHQYAFHTEQAELYETS